MSSENKVLKISALGGLFFSVLGISWGWAIQSEMILFDGMYSLIGLVMAMLSLYISNFIDKRDGDKFPFGKHIIEPLTVAFKSLILGGLCTITLLQSVIDVINGGNPVEYGAAVIYAFISTIGCLIVYIYMKKKSNIMSSDIIKVDCNQWLMDTILSAAVLLGFIIASILDSTSFNYFTKYVDPFMVIISASMFLKFPINTFVESFKEILSVKANDEINNQINIAVKEIETEYKFEESVTRVSKVGRTLRIEIDFVYNDKSKLDNLDEMDTVREKIYRKINKIGYSEWLNVSFTGDRKWVV